AARRGALVPIVAPSGSAERLAAPISTSRLSARGRIAASSNAVGRQVSTSFSEWTAASIRPSTSHASSSRVHSALPPISASGRSCTLSPLAMTGTSSTSLSAQPWTAQSRARVSSACAMASGERRVPSLRSGWLAIGALALASVCVQWKHPMRMVLGIESSCDETAAALVTDDRRILAQAIASQDDRHAPYGGVVPEIAARAHAERLTPLIERVLDEAGVSLADCDAIAATAGPGLIGGVMVGLVTAKALAMASDRPLLAVNHLEGHALSPRLADAELEFPYALLLVSGGHCQLLEVRGVGQYRRLATTIDDALGEAFDKTAKILGLGFPGGPAVEKLARGGDPKAVPLPRPLLGSAEPHFSFAGLKSAVLRAHESGQHQAAD